MKPFLAVCGFFFLLPLLICVYGAAYFARFYFFGEAVSAAVSDGYERPGIDDDANPVTRHYGSVVYLVHGTAHQLNNCGPHDQPLAVGSKLQVRYLRERPATAIAWPEAHLWWLACPILICLWVESLILGKLLA